MFAFMNAEALALTIETGVVHFWSRSRAALWKKGGESGNVFNVVEMRTDCDQDVLWLRVAVEGDGHACHTGRRSCFYRLVPVPGDAGAATAFGARAGRRRRRPEALSHSLYAKEFAALRLSLAAVRDYLRHSARLILAAYI